MGKNVINTNAKIASGVMSVNPDSILTEKTVFCKNVDNIGNAEMGINVMEENEDICENSAVMGKNIINTETSSPIDTYLDARLSGALEQLNFSEMTALNTLVFMGIQPPITTELMSYETEHSYSMAVGRSFFIAS